MRLKLILVLIALIVGPFTLRAANRIVLDEIPGPGYLPSLEIRRERLDFDSNNLGIIQRRRPDWVFIGDSMLGTRVDPIYLSELVSDRKDRVHLVMAPGSGPGWWFLAFKNYVAASGVKPRCTFFFFRDTNLTDTMFRLEKQYGHELDNTAHDAEPELDRIIAARQRGAWARLYSAVNRAYEIDIARMWMEPAVRGWLTRAKYGTGRPNLVFTTDMDQHFGVEHLRPDVSSDLGDAGEPDFARDVSSSILPDVMRLSREHQLPVCFVRVQRRPVGNRPPDESPALRQYVADLKAWIEANGGVFRDDTGDPEMTLDLYEDGDHFANRRRYSEILLERLAPIFRPSTSLGAP